MSSPGTPAAAENGPEARISEADLEALAAAGARVVKAARKAAETAKSCANPRGRRTVEEAEAAVGEACRAAGTAAREDARHPAAAHGPPWPADARGAAKARRRETRRNSWIADSIELAVMTARAAQERLRFMGPTEDRGQPDTWPEYRNRTAFTARQVIGTEVLKDAASDRIMWTFADAAWERAKRAWKTVAEQEAGNRERNQTRWTV